MIFEDSGDIMSIISYTPSAAPVTTMIHIQKGILEDAGTFIKGLAGVEKAALITDTNVAPLYGSKVLEALKKEGIESSIYAIQAGEEHKHLGTVRELYDFFDEIGITRTDVIVALGGGVVGDIAGMAAATYLRGVKIVQIPTTLLAQVDSAVGGKTGVDLKSGKNRVGVFHQPSIVLTDPEVLSTLPPEQLACGMAEVIKYACIKDSGLFEELEKGITSIDMEKVIRVCCEIKSGIVERDSHDRGERKLLNFGHTIGHAVERYYNYQGYLHGQAVAIGMCMLLKACCEIGGCRAEEAERIRALCRLYALPETAEIPKHELIELFSKDKKQEGSMLHLVLLHGIGQGYLYPCRAQELERYL